MPGPASCPVDTFWLCRGGEIVSETESEAMCKEEKDSETRERMQMQVLSRLQYANTVAFVICKWEITER